MKQSSIIDIGSTPYRGLQPYLETDAEFFFGRKREVRQLMAAAFSNPLTVVYGPSGVGKSSVLNAGLLHEIQMRGDLLGVTYSSWSDPDAMSAIATRMLARAVKSGAEVESDPSPLRQLKLIAEALEKQEAQEGPLRGPMVIVLDQFEDYTKYRERGREFHDLIVDGVNSLASSVSFIVSIREDNVTLLDEFKGDIPALFDNYLRIAYLDREQATEAITGPLDMWLTLHPEAAGGTSRDADGNALIYDDLIPSVLDDVSVGAVSDRRSERPLAQRDAGRIETAYLQLVMATLWESRGDEPMSLDLYVGLGKARRISRNHVSHVMSGLTEQERRLASLMIPHLVTASGLKLAQHAQDISERIQRDPDDLVVVLVRLEQSGRILRVLDPPDIPDELRRYEPYHDRIAEALIRWKDLYDASDPIERHRRRLRNQVKAAVATAKDRDGRVKVRGIERLGRLATQTVDRQIADKAADELKRILDEERGPLAGIVPQTRTYEKVAAMLKSRDEALVSQIVGEVQGALSSIEEALETSGDELYDDSPESVIAGIDDDSEAMGQNLPRGDEWRASSQWFASATAAVEPTAIQGDIEDISSLTAEHVENSTKGGSLGEIGGAVLSELGFYSSSQLDYLVARLRASGLFAQANQLETAGKQWTRPEADGLDQIEETPRWIRYPALMVATLAGVLVGVLLSSWWLERSGLPSPSELLWPLAVYTLLAVGEGLIVAELTYLDDWLGQAIAWFFATAIGWIAITSASLMVNVTFGVGLFWPLWILTAVVGIIGLGIAFAIADV